MRYRHKKYDDELLVDLLARRGLTHLQIARRLGISQSMVSLIAAGRARKELHDRIAHARDALAPDHRRPQPRSAGGAAVRSVIHVEYDDDLLVELAADATVPARVIASRVGISESMLKQILSRKARLDLQQRIDDTLRAKLGSARHAAAGTTAAGTATDDKGCSQLVRRGYDEDLLIELISRGDLSTPEIARRTGLSRATVWRILAGKARSDLQPRIRQAVADHQRQLNIVTRRALGSLVSMHISQGLKGQDELARKCREFVIKLIWNGDEDDGDAACHVLPTPGLTAEDYEAIAVLKGGPPPEEVGGE